MAYRYVACMTMMRSVATAACAPAGSDGCRTAFYTLPMQKTEATVIGPASMQPLPAACRPCSCVTAMVMSGPAVVALMLTRTAPIRPVASSPAGIPHPGCWLASGQQHLQTQGLCDRALWVRRLPWSPPRSQLQAQLLAAAHAAVLASVAPPKGRPRGAAAGRTTEGMQCWCSGPAWRPGGGRKPWGSQVGGAWGARADWAHGDRQVREI